MYTTKVMAAMKCCYDCGHYSFDTVRIPDYMLGHVTVCAECLKKHRDPAVGK